ncbi:hypothetical protein CO115_01235, partial [Candidatus Falkowbacteria bacterium CG_4_9_14_3_um_filter_36_9]
FAKIASLDRVRLATEYPSVSREQIIEQVVMLDPKQAQILILKFAQAYSKQYVGAEFGEDIKKEVLTIKNTSIHPLIKNGLVNAIIGTVYSFELQQGAIAKTKEIVSFCRDSNISRNAFYTATNDTRVAELLIAQIDRAQLKRAPTAQQVMSFWEDYKSAADSRNLVFQVTNAMDRAKLKDCLVALLGDLN